MTLSEKDFQAQVIALAHYRGWIVAHFRGVPVKRKGRVVHQTPVAADGKGFPDLVLAHPKGGVLFIELKTDKGRLSAEQKMWLDTLEQAGAECGVWRPRDFDEIVKPRLNQPRLEPKDADSTDETGR